MASMTKTRRTLRVACPWCGQDGEPVTVNLLDLDELTCGGCGREFTPAEALAVARAAAAKWAEVCAWLDGAPV